MASPGAHVNTASDSHEEHDHVEYRKRVATYIDGGTVSYEDADFTSGESPAVLDIFTDIGRIAHEGYFQNIGPGDLLVEISYDGTGYGGQHTLRGGDILSLDNLKIKKLRLTFVDATEYKAMIG